MNIDFILQQILNGVSLGGVYAMEAVGFGIIFNILKFSNFSHGAVLTICAYIGFFVSTHIVSQLIPALLITAVLGGFIAVLLEKLVFRPIRIKKRPLTYFFVSSITVMMIVQKTFSALWGRYYFPYPEMMESSVTSIGELVVSKVYLLMLAITAIVLIGLTIFLKKTKMGIAIRAASSDSWTPALMGVDTDFIISLTFFIAGVLAGITGYFLGMTYTVTPFIGELMLKGIIAAIIGGMGSLGGGVIAGLLLGITESILVAKVGASVTPILIYLSIFVLLLVRPQGISGKLYAVKA